MEKFKIGDVVYSIYDTTPREHIITGYGEAYGRKGYCLDGYDLPIYCERDLMLVKNVKRDA